MISRVDGAPTLPIKDEVDLAIEARAAEILREYDVTPEEAAQMARADVMQNMDLGGAPTPAGALARQHQDAGASPDRARKLADNQVRVYGPQGAWGLYREYETPDGMARLAEAQAENKAADARHKKMEDDYYTATGLPSHQTVSPATQRQWDSSERNAREAGRIIRSGLHPQTPVDPGTPEQNASWDQFLEDNPDEMARYRPEEAAASQKAADDQAWADRRPLLVKRYGEEEVAKMEAARAAGRVYVPNTKEQRERNQVTQDLETTAMQGSTPSRAVLQQRDKRRYAYVARPRQLRELGITPEEAKGMSDERIRIMLREKRAEEKQAKDLLWRPRTMIQAGNAIGAAALPGMDEWQLQMLAGGPTPLAVDAVGAQNALRMMNAEALSGMDPFRQRMAAEQREAQYDALPPEQQVAVSQRRGEPMGTGRSARHVMSRWNYWMKDGGWDQQMSPRREAGFRREMEALGYKPQDIDAFVDAQRGGSAAPAQSPAAANPWATGGA